MDPWNKTAQKFYDEFGTKKNSAAFIKAYPKILNRISLSFPPSPFPAHVLDLGCGTGELALVLSEAGFQVTGVDVSKQSLVKAKEIAPAGCFLEADMTKLPVPDHSMDAVFAMTSLEFCRDKTKALQEIRRVLKPGGFFYLEVRNADFVLNVVSGKWKRFFTRTRLLKVYPAESFKDLAYEEWRSLFREASFKIEQEYSSLRPWAYGSLLTRVKNLFIEGCKFLFPLSRQYMTAFLLRSI
ncbi:MAG: class I SAM-dependent methyltransferase [Candidatus Omnitrophica bacterium]|nr:class I SAM-dependent methyltransferase [Candidatus Omnitrophota bacterium]